MNTTTKPIKAPFDLAAGLLAHADEFWSAPSGAFTLLPATGSQKNRVRHGHDGCPVEIHPSFRPKQKPVRSPRTSK